MAQFLPSLIPATDDNGDILAGAMWEFYVKGTTTPAAIEGGLTSITSNSEGEFGIINLLSTTSYRALLKDADGKVIYEVASVDTRLFDAGVKAALNASKAASGATWSFYTTATTDPLAVYADPDLVTPLGAVVQSNASGVFPEIYLDTAQTYKAVLNVSGSETTIDPVTDENMGLFFDPNFSSPLGASEQWDGTAGTGFGTANPAAPSDPTRTTAKPICRPLFRPRQTVTGTLTIGVGAGANNLGSLFDNLGLNKVTFHLEGNSQEVTAPTVRPRTRPDGSTWQCLGWWTTLERTDTNGWGDLYIEAEPKDATMQNRVVGPIKIRFAENEHDWTGTVGAGGDYADMGAAFDAIAAATPENPLIEPIDATDYSLAGGSSSYTPSGWCTIRPSAASRFVEAPPALEFDFTRIRPRIGNLCFDGANCTHDFVETLQFNPLTVGDAPAYINGAKIRQSRGREDLWRKIPRNILPALFSGTNADGTVYLDGADIQDVNDVGDKTSLAINCVITNTWGDLFQGASTVVGCKVTNHSSSFYYTNVDALTVQYTGSAATGQVERRSGSFRLYEDGVEVDRFTLDSSEAGFRTDTNYRVASLVAWIDGKTDWTATLIDDTRAAAFISEPGTTNGSNFGPIDAKTSAITLPTHFDIHSDFHQVANSSFLENTYIAQNECWDNDMQNFLDAENVAGNIKDKLTILNVFHNRTGVPDEALQSSAGAGSHNVFVGNTLATQRLTVPTTSINSDGYSLIAGNVSVRLTATVANANTVVKDNHITQDVGTTTAATGTSVGGDFTTLFADAANGDFAPAGLLLTNLITPLTPRDITGATLSGTTEKGAVT